MNEFDYPVKIDWDHKGDFSWNETCAQVLEVFGLPGHRFIYHPYDDYMVFKFKNKSDQYICQILLSEKL